MTYPLGLPVSGRKVLVVGGGSDAARSVPALVEEGAVVEVVAPRLHDDLGRLADRGALTWHRRGFRTEDLDGAWLVLTCTGSEAARREVQQAAERRRIFCVAGGETPAPGAPRAAHPAVGPPQPPGTVALVGGGPGDPGLLTLRGWTLLAGADVVVADRLGPTELLPGLAQHAEVVDVGKRAGYHKVTQDRINETLVVHARAGRRVVRLKGGDPYVFGRGGEEVEFCHAHGVPTQVVPGVTSAISVPAAAGIPVTHRDLAHGFTVITAHQQLHHVPYREGHTLILMMGVLGLERNSEILMDAGYPADTPVAVVERGWTPTQRTTVAELSTIAGIAAQRGVAAPAVILVGKVAALGREGL